MMIEVNQKELSLEMARVMNTNQLQPVGGRKALTGIQYSILLI